MTHRRAARQPAAVLSRLNDYFDRMVEAITSHGGTVDKFVGDALVAVFGGATALTNPAEAALDAAIAMRAKLRQLNHERLQAGLAPIDNGIGVTFGEVLYGPVGSLDHKQPTVLGDVVNAALQLEATTVDLRLPILASASVADALPPARRDAVRSLGEVVVKGRRHPMLVYAANLDEDTDPGAEPHRR
ncbi:MAG TPA: adenylate/guanylate cyclase domain-containing protein [Kofleriaceae bacterium]|nr:adenylate/guanylate cyclase domain-containing protein [Kofleriaceae bacterium]